MNPFKFLDESYLAKTGGHLLSISEDFVILTCIIMIQYKHLTCDSQIDRLTDI